MEHGKCACVILNFNDAETTAALVKRIQSYDCIRSVLVVDNCSTDDSLEKLNELEDRNKIVVLKTEYNGGYGYGNNFGVRYAYEVLGERNVLIINPDVTFSESCLIACLDELRREEEIAVVSPVQYDSNGNPVPQFAWNLGSGLRHLASCEVFLRHTLFPLPCVKADMSADRAFVDCVPGSYLLVDAEKFLLSGGYHPDMFLYWEETLLGHRIKRSGGKTVLLPRQAYYHRHAVSVNKSVPQTVVQRQIQHNSLLICLREVWGYGKIRLTLARWFLKLCLAEEKVLAKCKLMISGRSNAHDV